MILLYLNYGQVLLFLRILYDVCLKIEQQKQPDDISARLCYNDSTEELHNEE